MYSICGSISCQGSIQTHHSWRYAHANVEQMNGLLVKHCRSVMRIDGLQISVDLVRVERVELRIRSCERCNLVFVFAGELGR